MLLQQALQLDKFIYYFYIMYTLLFERLLCLCSLSSVIFLFRDFILLHRMHDGADYCNR